MQNASHNDKTGTPSTENPSEERRVERAPALDSEMADALVMHIARVASLANQCDREGNPATAIALRRVAEALWGDAFRLHPEAQSEKKEKK